MVQRGGIIDRGTNNLLIRGVWLYPWVILIFVINIIDSRAVLVESVLQFLDLFIFVNEQVLSFRPNLRKFTQKFLDFVFQLLVKFLRLN